MGCPRVNFTLHLEKHINLLLSDRPEHFIMTVDILQNVCLQFVPAMEISNITANISKLYTDIRNIYASISRTVSRSVIQIDAFSIPEYFGSLSLTEILSEEPIVTAAVGVK